MGLWLPQLKHTETCGHLLNVQLIVFILLNILQGKPCLMMFSWPDISDSVYTKISVHNPESALT